MPMCSVAMSSRGLLKPRVTMVRLSIKRPACCITCLNSISAWWDVDRGRAWFRLVWVAVLAGSLVVEAAIMLIVLTA